MPNIGIINEFLVLAETLNYREASERLFITQPALSRHIQALENYFGAPLFTRTTRSTSLTSEGVLARQELQEVQRILDQLTSDIAKTKGDIWNIHMSCPNYWIVDIGEPLVTRFCAAYPQASCDFKAHQPTDGVRNVLESIDDVAFGVALPPVNNAGLGIHYFAHERLAAIMASSNPLASAPFLDVKTLQGTTLIFIDERDGGFDRMNHSMLAMLDAYEVHPESTVTISQIESVGRAITSSHGICLMPYSLRHLPRRYDR